MSPQDDDLPFVLNVEDAFRLTSGDTVIYGVIEQGSLHIGDYLELIQPGGAGKAAPPRFRCRGVDLPRVTDRDPALEPLVAVWVGYRVDPDAIQAGAKLRAVAEPSAETRADRRRQRKADKLARAAAPPLRRGPGAGKTSKTANRTNR